MDQQKVDAESLTKTSRLASVVLDKYQTARTQRVLQEQLWIESLQNFNGEYGPAITFREGGSSVFVNITQMKTMAAFARMQAIFFGAAGFPWNIKPTPHPQLVKLGLSQDAALAHPEISPEFKAVVAEAKSRADGMKNRIRDDLVEMRWEEKFSRGLLDLCVLGTMCFKGPVGMPTKPKRWVLDDGRASLIDKIKARFGAGGSGQAKYRLMKDPDDAYRADIEWVSPFELYIDPGAYSVEDAMWVVQRHVYNKAQVVELASGRGFDAEEIESALNNNPDGNWYSEPWEGFINIINRQSQSPYLSKRYTVLEYWGWLSGRELKEAGASVQDGQENSMHLANVWVLGNNCIKVAISGLEAQKLPFFVTPYEKVPYKVWGRGVPEKMADPQAIINATARAMVENMGMASGPQLIYDVNRVMPGTKVDQITPWGIWPIKNIEGVSTPPVEFKKIDPILNELKLIQDTFRTFATEVTSLPDMASGMSAGTGEHNRTMGGMSMLFGAADAYTRAVVFNVDNYLTKPMIRALYDWEMQFCPDSSIKGDMSVEASGVQGLMAKELTSQRMSDLLQAIAQLPGGSDYINMPEIMKELFRSLDVTNDSVVFTEEEVAEKRRVQAQQQMQAEAQKAQFANQPKPKAETTRNDAILQVLERTQPSDPIYAVMYAKLLEGYNELDDQAHAALMMMKARAVIENRKFSDSHEMEVMQQDFDLEQKLRGVMNDPGQPPYGPGEGPMGGVPGPAGVQQGPSGNAMSQPGQPGAGDDAQ